MIACHVRDGPLTESEISKMTAEEMLDFLRGILESIFFDESNSHPITRKEWSSIVVLMRNTPVIAVLPDGKKVLDNTCAHLLDYYENHQPSLIEDRARIVQIKKWAEIYGLNLEIKGKVVETA